MSPSVSSEEDSLLVATHDQTAAEPAAADSSPAVLEPSATDQPLEPVSDFSEPTPELAEGESQSEEAASQEELRRNLPMPWPKLRSRRKPTRHLPPSQFPPQCACCAGGY